MTLIREIVGGLFPDTAATGDDESLCSGHCSIV
jgi:hypothetical protein